MLAVFETGSAAKQTATKSCTWKQVIDHFKAETYSSNLHNQHREDAVTQYQKQTSVNIPWQYRTAACRKSQMQQAHKWADSSCLTILQAQNDFRRSVEPAD